MDPSRAGSSDYLDLENRPSRRFIMLGRLCARCLADMYTRKYKLTTTGWEILALIGRREPIHPNEIVELTTMESDKVSRTVEMLVRKGFVLRTDDVEDRRRVILRLSAKGRKVHDDIDATRRSLDADMLSVLSDREQADFFELLSRLESYVHETYRDRQAWSKVAAKRPQVSRA